MLNNRLVWRMGAFYLWRQRRQTLLSLLAGAIGAMLITLSLFHYGSVKTSGNNWIKAHFGPIDWEAVPSQKQTFSANELARIEDKNLPYRYLPVVQSAVTLFASSSPDADSASLQSSNMLGFEFAQAATFDPNSAAFWQSPIKRGEALLNSEAANWLGLREGDAVYAADGSGMRHGFVLKATPRSSGLTGYRGDGAKLAGTLLLHPDDARMLAGVEANQVNQVLIARINPDDPVTGISRNSNAAQLADYKLIKSGALAQTNSSIVFVILAISMTAVFSSAFLLRQIILMLAESRAELYGVLRAVGLSRWQARSLFRAEALLLALLSATIGIAAGLAGGYVLTRLMYKSEFANTIGATGIPIAPGVPSYELFIGVASVFAYQIAIVWMASRKAASGGIVALMRGSLREGGDRQTRSRLAAVKAIIVLIAAVVITAVHIYHTFSWSPVHVFGAEMLRYFGFWLASAAAIVFLLQLLIGGAGRIGGARSGLSGLLATRYAGQRPGRSFTLMLLFAAAMLGTSFTSAIGGLLLKGMDPTENVQTVLGYEGVVPYESEREKQEVQNLLKQDEWLRQSVSGSADVNPIMAAPQLVPGGSRSGQAFVSVTQQLVSAGGWKLSDRADSFQSDDEAWRKVMSDPSYIILPVSYRDYRIGQTTTFSVPEKLFNAGDSIHLSFYRKEAVSNKDKPDLTLTFTIAGFADENTEQETRTQYLFNTTYVHPEIMNRLADYDHPWDNQNHQGLLLLDLRDPSLERYEQLKSRLISGGATTVELPYLENWKEHEASSRLIDGVILFTVLSAVIGLLGLAVLQKRSIAERRREIAMLRSAGVPTRKLCAAFVLEGSLLSAIGLLAGWAVGLSGAHGFARITEGGARPWEQTPQLAFNWPFLSGIMLIMLALAVVFQLGPARSALKDSPADALRNSEP